MDEGTEAQALQEEYRRVSGGAEVCVRCGQVFSAADATARSLGCSYHSGDYVVETDAEGAASLYLFTCCQAQEEIFWGGAPLYDTLIPLVAKGPVYVSSGGCCSTRHVALGDGEVLVEAVPAWRLRLLKRRLSSLIDDRKRIQEADRQKATSVMRGMHNCLWDVGDGITFFGRNLTFGAPTSQSLAKNDAPITNTGLRIWDGAIVLAKYLEHRYEKDHWSGKRVLEVGAGCGLVGLALGLQGAEVVLTDREEVVPTLQENVQRNINALTQNGDGAGCPSVNVAVKELDWREDATGFVDDGGYDYIMAADVIGFPAVLDILATTLHTLMFSPSVTATQRATRCVMSYKVRDERVESSFLEKMAAKGFHMTEVARSDMHPIYRADSIHIVVFTRPKA